MCKLQLIAVKMDGKTVESYKLADITNPLRQANGLLDKSQPLRTEWFDPAAVADMILNNKATIVGIQSNGLFLEGSNGSFNRYANLKVVEPNKKYPLTVFERVNINGVDGCTVLDADGRILTVNMDKLVKYAEAVGISNGKVVEHNGMKFISSIRGEYNRIGIKASYENVATPVVEKVDDIQLVHRVKRGGSNKPGYWPDGAKLRDEKLNLTAEEKIVVCFKVIQNWNFFIYSILSQITIIPLNPAAMAMPTMGVDVNMTLIYNPYFVIDLPLEQLVLILLHETYHILFSHPARIMEMRLAAKNKGTKTGLPIREELNLYNIAADLFVNKYVADQFATTLAVLVDRPHTVLQTDPFVTNRTVKSWSRGIKTVQLPDGLIVNDRVDCERDTIETLFKDLIEEQRRKYEEQRAQQQAARDNSSNSDDESDDESENTDNQDNNDEQPENSDSSQDYDEQNDSTNDEQGEQSENTDESDDSDSSTSDTGDELEEEEAEQADSDTDGKDKIDESGESSSGTEEAGQSEGDDDSGEEDQDVDYDSDEYENESGAGGYKPDLDEDFDEDSDEEGQMSMPGDGQSDSEDGDGDDSESDYNTGSGADSDEYEDSDDEDYSDYYENIPARSMSERREKIAEDLDDYRSKLDQLGNDLAGTDSDLTDQDILDMTPDEYEEYMSELRDWKEKLKSTVLKAEVASQSRGLSLSESERRLVDSIIRPIPINWKVLLKRMFNMAATKASSFKRPSRRPEIGNNVILPGKTKKEPEGLQKIVFAIDTSGSVGDAELKYVLGTIRALTNKYKVDVEILWWSTKVNGIVPIKNENDLVAAYKNVASDGGTCATNMFKYLTDPRGPYKGKKLHGLIIFTDGHIDTVDPEYKRVAKNILWMIHSRQINSFTAPFGVVSYIEVE